MADFHPLPKGGVRLELEDEEAALLRQLTAELTALLEAQMPADPVLGRLLPRAYENEGDERDYRNMIGDDLEREKIAALERVGAAAASTTVSLSSEEEVASWLASLTDLRLAIGTRLDVDEERMSAGVDPSDPDAPALTVLHWLGWLQEGIIHTLEPTPGDADA